MSHPHHLYRLLVSILVVSMLLGPAAQMPVTSAAPDTRVPTVQPPSAGLYRTRVVVDSPARRARLDQLDVTVLSEGPGWAVVLVDADQLETLARLRFEPRASDDLAALAAAAGPEKAWLTASLQPLLAQAERVQTQRAAAATAKANAATAPDGIAALHAAMQALTPEQAAGIAAMPSDDYDGDGLTNTEEAWWCTDPQDPNSDGDALGYTDGQEVDALLDFTLSRTVRWGYGPPFGPPAAWPNFNNRDGTGANVCNDGDYDTIPDYAEAYIVGTRTPAETTDGDKFDDGQELFGTTYCPGGTASCGYGSYPRIEYWNYIQADMPGWVRPPGDNPFVAAFPVPEVNVTPGSWHMSRATVITTTQGQMTQTEHSYETSVTEGQSTSIADSVTWNNWEEVSESIETPIGGIVRAQSADGFNWGKIAGGTALVAGGGALGWAAVVGLTSGIVACTFSVVCGLALAGGVAVLGAGGAVLLDQGFNEDTNKDQLQSAYPVNMYNSSTSSSSATANANAQATVVLNNNIDVQGIANSLDGVQYAINQQGQLLARGLQDISYAISQPRYTETRTNGHSWGGAQTTTHEAYEEHTIAEGQAFTTGESWSTAWAIDSSHAANLTFEFTIKNTGTEYARELTGMIVNVYIGDDTSPSISYPAWEKFPNGKIENLFPGASHTFTTNPITLNLDQMRRIDLGERLTVVVEDYSYGADELFYENAVSSGMTVHIEDGIEDGDESVDSYVIPTWSTESVLDVLTRYCPAGYDAEGNIKALWTPEFDGTHPPAWNEHYLSDIAWWNIYLTQADAGNTPLQDIPAQAGGAMLFRFNRDSDRDGYNDRAEFRYYCGLPADDPDYTYCTNGHLRAEVHPQPEVLAGYVTSRSANVMTVKLVVENTGTFDAYGIDAVMYSPDDTTTIGNNTVGGNGRARPGQHVAVGSLVKAPDLTNWGSSTSSPYTGGNYTGIADRTYTFTASTPGVVGQGSTALSWSDGAGNSGSIPVGDSYHAPLPEDVADGLQIGLNTGTILAGTSFTVQALTPRDTFTYTIESEPFTPPVIALSYSDPQGSHRFVTPVELTALDASLAPYSGQMLEGLQVQIVTPAAFNAAGANTTNLVVNNPHSVSIEDGHLYLNFVSDGVLALEKSYTLDILAGPTVFPADWSVTEFSPDYNPDGDNILIVFWTDSEGNIIDSAARPLNSFAEDPKPAFAMTATDATWDFGTAAQGTILKRSFTFANTGDLDLLTYVSAPAGLTVSQTGSRKVGPADMTTYEMVLNTANLAVEPYNGTITIRTSDPDNPTRTVHVIGAVAAMPADTPVGAMQRPMDAPAPVTGTQGQWVEFAHSLGPEPSTLHPVKVYNQDYGTLKGVGKYATPFAAGTAAYDMFGDGRDGVMPTSGNLDSNNGIGIGIVSSGTAGAYSINVTDAQAGSRINIGDAVVIHQTQGTGAGCWELNKAASDYAGGAATIQLTKPLRCSYVSSGDNHAQVQRVPQYSTCLVSGTVTPLTPWNGTYGGILAVMCNSAMNVIGSITASGRGYRGGAGAGDDWAWTGEGDLSPSIRRNIQNPPGNGGGANHVSCAGGGHGTAGVSGGEGTVGDPAGTPDLSTMVMGGGGGGAGVSVNAGSGGAGGGIIVLVVRSLSVTGSVSANGGAGQSVPSDGRSGCGGAGGAVFIQSQDIAFGSGAVTAAAGPRGTGGADSHSGDGGVGRIHAEFCNTPLGWASPAADPKQLTCYIADQATDPTSGLLNLPASGAYTYQVQYGRKLNWTAAATKDTMLRVPAGIFTSVTLQALISDLSANASFSLDVGATGAPSWSGTVGNNSTNDSPNLAAYFNAYWAGHGAPTTDFLNVPVRVTLDRTGQVLLTNLKATVTGSRTRYLRVRDLPQRYSSVTAAFTVSGGSGPLAVGADVGADGTVEWTYTGSPTYPAGMTTGNLATAVNAYLATHWSSTGEPDVPIRFALAPFATLSLTGFSATPVGQPDAQVGGSDVSFSATSPTEGEEVTVTALLHNPGSLDTGPIIASFVATATVTGQPQGLPLQIGNVFVPNVPAGGAAQAQIPWNTLGFTGATPVRVTVDPFNRLAESSEANNQAATSLTIKTRPDLSFDPFTLSDEEPVAGEPITVTLTLRNNGQTAAVAQTVALYEGNPDAGGTVLGTNGSPPLPGGGTDSISFVWTPAAPGLQHLTARADRDDLVNEFDENNNDRIAPIYVGLAGPVLLDSGAPAADPLYTPTTDYGAVDEGQADVTVACGASAAETLRRDPDGRVVYRFDHLLPGHFYHLDTTLYECDGAHRQETISVDGNALVGPVDLSDAQAHRFSTRLDPALYADRTISVTVEAPGINGAVVSEVNLHDVDYRYADAGASSDLAYSAGRGFGWLNGVANSYWGLLPYQNVRVNQSGNELHYRFDKLAATRRYQVNLTLYQGDAVNVIEEVLVDGLATGVIANLSDRQPHYLTVDVPVEAYRGDGSIVVAVRRTNGSTGAFANEIAIEEKTLLTLPAISDLQVSNVTAEQATISWLTDAATDGAVHFGATTALGGIALDERGAPVSDRTHQVTLLNLTAATTYHFYVISSDAIDDNSGAYYQFTTGPAFDPNAPDLAFGRVLQSDGSTLAAGALVRARLRDDDAQGTSGDSALRSALVDNSGYWSFDLAATRTPDHSQLFEYSLAGDLLVLDVTDGAGCTASRTVDTGLDTPAADIILVCPTQVTHSLASGWSLLGLNVMGDVAPTAEEALDDIVAQGGSAIEIERWWNGGWEAHVRNLPFNNFTLELGRGYFVRSSAASAWTRTGRPLVAPLTVHLYPGWNLIGLPKLTSTLFAEDLLTGIATQGGACPEVDRWVSGGWVGHPKGYPVNNFAITTTEGYFVKCTQQSTYTPGATLLASGGPAQPPAPAGAALQSAAAPVIYDVMVTNLRDVAFSVTWRTDQPSTGWISYQAGGGPEASAEDERGAGVVSTLHQVTVVDLTPETAYNFRVHAGDSIAEHNGNGQPFQAVTLATTAPGVPLTAFGQVLDNAGQPAAGALVRAWLVNADDSRSAPLSALVESGGYWALSLPAEACAEKQLALSAFGPDGAVAQGLSPACAEDVQPAPPLTLQPKARMPIYLPLVVR